jgi:hypothetical protein
MSIRKDHEICIHAGKTAHIPKMNCLASYHIGLQPLF